MVSDTTTLERPTLDELEQNDPGYNPYLDKERLDYKPDVVIQEEDQLNPQSDKDQNNPLAMGMDKVLQRSREIVTETPGPFGREGHDKQELGEELQRGPQDVSLDAKGKNDIVEGRVERNKGYDQQRDNNEKDLFNPKGMRVRPGVNDERMDDQNPGGPNDPGKWLIRTGAEPSYIFDLIDKPTFDVAQGPNGRDIRTLFPTMPKDELKQLEAEPPRELPHQYKGETRHIDIPKTLDQPGHENGIFTDALHPDLLKLPQDQYEIRNVPGHENVFHIRKRPALVGEDDTLPPNAQLAQYEQQGSTYEDLKEAYEGAPPDLIPPKAYENLQQVTPEQRDGLRWDAPILSSKDPAMHEGTREELFNHIDEALREKQEDKDARHQESIRQWNEMAAKDKKVKPTDPNEPADMAGRLRMRFTPAAKEYLENLPDDVDAIDLKDGTILFQLRKALTSENDQLPKNAQLAQFTPNAEQKASYEEFKANVLDAQEKGNQRLAEYLDTPFGRFMDAIMTGMGAMGGRGPGIRVTGRSGLSVPKSTRTPANENMTSEEHISKIENNTKADTTSKSLSEIEKEAAANVSPRTAFERALERQKAGKPTPTGDSVEELAKSLKGLKLVDTNPSQEPQSRPDPGSVARETQAAQQKVNVGPGKGVLNDNVELVGAMVAKGMTPGQIAKRFDISPLSVRNWIKRKGGIDNIEDIIKKRMQRDD